MSCVRTLLAACLALGALSGNPALAQSTFTVRVPVTTTSFQPQVQAFDFGSVAVGSRPVRTFQLVNRSTATLKLLSTSTLGQAVIDANACPSMLPAGANCQVTVALPVSSTGTFAGEVRVLSDASTVPEVLRVSALGSASSALLSVTPGTLSFGDVAVGASSATQTFTVRNGTAAEVHLGTLYMAENATYFPLTSSCPEELAANQSCTVSVRFTPRLEGNQQARLVRDLPDGTSLYVASVSGAGVRAEATWTMTQVDFVGLPVGAKSSIQEVGLTNTGRGALAIGSLSIAGDTAFRLEGHTCGTSLAAGASCVVRLSVTPPDTLVRSATLKLESTSLESRSSLVQLYARPEAQLAMLALSPLSVAFGELPVGVTSASRTVTMSATGTLPVAVTAVTLGGANPADFVLVNPTACVGTLNPGQSCSVQLAARPSAALERSASLTVVSSSVRLVEPVLLTARGAQGQLLAVPSPLAFGEIASGEQNTRAVTLSNVGGAALSLQTPSLSGTHAALFSSTGCAGQTLAPGASCTLSVRYAPTSAGAHVATLLLPNTGVTPAYSVPVSGSARALPQSATLGEFSCPDWSPYNQTVTCSATLTNNAASTLTVGALTRANTAFSVASTCGTSLAVGASCTISASVPTGTWSSGATQRTLSSAVTLATGAGSFTRTATVKADVSQLAWSIAAYEPVATGATGTATHTLTNTGKFPVRLARTPVLEAVTPAGSLAVTASTCGTDLAVGQSCTMTVRCNATTASAAATYTARLLAEGSNYAKDADALGCPVFVQVPTASFRMVPSVLDFGQVAQGVSVARTVTLENDSLVPIPVSAWSVLGEQAAEFTLSGACTKVPARVGTTPGRCSSTLTFRPAATGVRQASIEAVSSSLGLRATGTLLGNGALSVLTGPSLDFGSVALGNLLQKSLVLSNTGPVAVTLPASAGWTMGSGDPASFSLNVTACASKVLAVGATCTVSATFKPTGLGSKGTQLSVSALGARPLTVALSGTGVPAPAPVVSPGPLNCQTPSAVGGTTACTLVLSNRGDAALPMPEQPLVSMNVDLAGVGSTLPAGVTRAPQCGAKLTSLAAGSSCTFAFTLPVQREGANLARFRLRLGTYPEVNANAQVQGLVAAATLVTVEHPRTQTGATSVAVHRLTNTGAVPLVLTQTGAQLASVTGTKVIQFTGAPASGKACTSPLAVGESCQLQTSCSSTTPARHTGTLVLGTSVSGASVSAPVVCEVTAPTFEVAPAGALTTQAGAWSDSGSFWRVTNTGAGPLTFVGAFPSDDAWTMVSDSREATHCKAKATLQAGASCVFLSRLVKAAPDSTMTGLHRVRMDSGTQKLERTFTDSIQSMGVAMTVTTPFKDLQTLNTQVAEVTLVNRAAWPLSQTKVVMDPSAGFTLLSHTCPAVLAAAGQPASSCVARVQLLSSTVGSRVAKLRVEGSYPQVVNRQAQSPVRAGVQGRIDLSATVVAPRLTVLTTEHAGALTYYPSAPATHLVRNDGVGELTMRSVSISLGTGFLLKGGTCVPDLVLKPGDACTVITTFTPGRWSALRTTGELTAVTHAATAKGTLVGVQRIQGDVFVRLNFESSMVLVGRTTRLVAMVQNDSIGVARVELDLQAQAEAPASITKTGALLCGYIYAGSTSCSVSGTKARFTVNPGARAYVYQDISAGPTAGTLRASAGITVQDVEDTKPENNFAEASTPVQYPHADLALSIAPATRKVGPGAGGELAVTVRNVSAASTVTAPSASLVLSASATGSSGASASLGAARCTNTQGSGAQCVDGLVTLPPNTAATLSLPYSVGSGLGQVAVSVSPTPRGAPFHDPVSSNNTATAVLTVERPTADYVLSGALSGSGTSRYAAFIATRADGGTEPLRAEFSFTSSNPAASNPTAIDTTKPVYCMKAGRQVYCAPTASGRLEMWTGMTVMIPLKAGEGTLTVRGVAHDVDGTDANAANNVAEVEFNGLAAPCNGKFKVLPDSSVLCLNTNIVFTQPRYPGCRDQCNYRGYVQVSKPRSSFYAPFEYHGNVGPYTELYSSAPSYLGYGYTRENWRGLPVELDYDWDARTAWYVVDNGYSKDIYQWDKTCSYSDGTWWSGSANPCRFSHVQGYSSGSYSLVGVRSDGTVVGGGSMCADARGFQFNMTARTLTFSGCTNSTGVLTIPR